MVLGHEKWKVSLRTGNETEAARKARVLAVEHDAILQRLERDGPANYLLAELDKQTDAARRHTLVDKLIAAADARVARLPVAERALLQSGVAVALAELRKLNGAVAIYELAMENAPEEMKLDVPLPDDLTEPEKQAEELRLRHAAALGYREDLTNLTRLQGALAATGAIRRPAKAPQGDTISVIFDKWTASQGQRVETVRKWRIYKRRLVDVIGDKLVRNVTKADVRNYVEAAAKLHASKDTLLTAATVGRHLDFARAFFRWAARQDYCDASPAQDIQAPKDRHADDRKPLPFTWGELQQLVEGARQRWGPQSPQTFVVLVGIYTGARLEEICQLAPGNLELHGCVYAIRIDALDGRKLKNAASRRVVPLPSSLIDAGFVDFASAQQGKATIFGLPLVSGRYGRSFSASFRRLRESVGLVGPRLRFHSLRHSYADMLRAKKVPDDASAQLMGHVGNRVRAGYGHGYGLDVLKGWVDLLEVL